MDHAEALEQIEIAAAEPDGIDRLMAGDTAEAAALAGHLAGCPACVAELARMRRVAAVARQVIVEEPDPALRERTLAFVRANGADRSAAVGTSGATVAAGSSSPALPSPASPSPAPAGVRAGRGRTRYAWWAGMAAAVLVAGVVGFVLGGGSAHDEYPPAVAVMTDAAARAVALAGQPGTQVVELAPTPAGAGASGTVALSTTGGGIVMLATGLRDPGSGAEYGCWVETGGERRRIGTMVPAGTTYAWSGAVDGLANLPAGTTFGVSLVREGENAGAPVLTGSL